MLTGAPGTSSRELVDSPSLWVGAQLPGVACRSRRVQLSVWVRDAGRRPDEKVSSSYVQTGQVNDVFGLRVLQSHASDHG